jgi:phage terminase large subunit
MAAQKPLRVACVREVQESIKKSVHQLLKDQISLLGFDSFFDIQETVIKAKNGSEFTFSGLSTQTRDSIKSMEGCDIAWCEEAQSISGASWDILIPTIRKPGSEIWITFNPSLESDETFQRFVVNPPPDSAVIKLNYHDNPWFPAILEQERKHCQATNPDDYPNIWEGECKPAVEGAIYFREIQAAQIDGRICRVPYDPLLKVHLVFDLGFNDLMAIGLVQKFQSNIRIIRYIEGRGQTLAAYSSDIRALNFNWGRCWLPHDGYSRDFKTGMSSAEIMRSLGWDVPDRSEIVELSIEEGIRSVRMMFPQIIFDEANTGALIECLKRYRRQINRTTSVAGAPLHDDFSNGADFLRYCCINAPQMSNSSVDDYWMSAEHNRQTTNDYDQATGY